MRTSETVPLDGVPMPEVFSRITLLKALVQSYFPSEYDSFIDELTKHCVHPLIISFSLY